MSASQVDGEGRVELGFSDDHRSLQGASKQILGAAAMKGPPF